MFTDKARIFIASGKGGDGHVSFRREKFVPNGGPDGGDGGKGGDLIFEVDEGLNTLGEFRHKGKYAAEHGEDGKKRNMAGHGGKDLVIKVPEGTVVREAETGKVIVDMSGETKRFTVLTGGRGGNGNQHYATSTMQAPKYAQPGQPSKQIEVILELKVIADVGLVGYPNVGKSTLLSIVSNAKPKVANYHFTTLTPMLGVVDLDDAKGFVMADIPGLIEGAAEGVGLGHEFLAHIERCRLLIHLVDASGSEGRDPIEDIEKINDELRRYKIDLTQKKQVIVCNKTDLIDPELRGTELDPVALIRNEYEPRNYRVFEISAATKSGVREMLYGISEELSLLPEKTKIFEQEFNPETDIVTGEEPFTVWYDAEDEVYRIEGPRIDRMLGYTNLETEKGLTFFQKFMVDNGIIKELKKLGVKEGDTIRIYGHAFEYYD